jgi:miniconductance mechanosensitive channel
MAVLVSALIALFFLADFVLRKILIGYSQNYPQLKTNFDDLLIRNKAPRNIHYISSNHRF